jgi:hypothetical protein
MKKFRMMKKMAFPASLDLLFSINPQEVAVLGKAEMLEVLDTMYELNKRREQLTANRVRLTE